MIYAYMLRRHYWLYNTPFESWTTHIRDAVELGVKEVLEVPDREVTIEEHAEHIVTLQHIKKGVKKKRLIVTFQTRDDNKQHYILNLIAGLIDFNCVTVDYPPPRQMYRGLS